MNHIAALMAGQVAEELTCGGRTLPGRDAGDVRIALEFAARLVESDVDQQALLEEGRRRARDILTHPWSAQALSGVVNAFLDSDDLGGGISGETVRKIVREAKRAVSKGE